MTRRCRAKWPQLKSGWTGSTSPHRLRSLGAQQEAGSAGRGGQRGQALRRRLFDAATLSQNSGGFCDRPSEPKELSSNWKMILRQIILQVL